MGRTIADLGALAVVSAALLATPALAGKKNDKLNIAWDQPLDIADAYYNTSREGILAARMIWDQLIERDPTRSNTSPAWPRRGAGSTTSRSSSSCAAA